MLHLYNSIFKIQTFSSVVCLHFRTNIEILKLSVFVSTSGQLTFSKMSRKYYMMSPLCVFIHGFMLPVRNLAIIYYISERKKIGKGPSIIKILLLFVPHQPVDVL